MFKCKHRRVYNDFILLNKINNFVKSLDTLAPCVMPTDCFTHCVLLCCRFKTCKKDVFLRAQENDHPYQFDYMFDIILKYHMTAVTFTAIEQLNLTETM